MDLEERRAEPRAKRARGLAELAGAEKGSEYQQPTIKDQYAQELSSQGTAEMPVTEKYHRSKLADTHQTPELASNEESPFLYELPGLEVAAAELHAQESKGSRQ